MTQELTEKLPSVIGFDFDANDTAFSGAYHWREEVAVPAFNAMREAKEAAEGIAEQYLAFCNIKATTIDALKQSVADVTDRNTILEAQVYQLTEAYKLSAGRAEQAEATSYLPMIPEGKYCESCPFLHHKTKRNIKGELETWNQCALYSTIPHNSTGIIKLPDCPKSYIEPKGVK